MNNIINYIKFLIMSKIIKKSGKYILEEMRIEELLIGDPIQSMYDIINLVNKLSEQIKYNININKYFIYKLGINSKGEEEGISNRDYNIIMRVIDIICNTDNYIISNIKSKFIDETLDKSVYEIMITK